LRSTFLLDQHSGGGMHAMLGTLPIMLVLSPVIYFSWEASSKEHLEKSIAFYLKKSSTLLHTLVSPVTIIGHHMCNEGCHILSGGMSSFELLLVKNTPPDPAGFS
jgi:hypothetical protein